jgi:uncharacterized membrane protein YhaH (DUF805 family)
MTDDSRGGWKGLVRRTPLWILVLVIAAAYAALQLGMRLLRGKEVAAEDVAIYGAFGVVFGIFTLWMTVRTGRKGQSLPPGLPTASNIQKAISTGELPEQASAAQWEPELVRILVQERYMMWIGPILFGLFTAMGIFLIFDDPEHPWFGVFVTPIFLGLTIWCQVSIPRRRVRIEKLLAQFPEKESIWR